MSDQLGEFIEPLALAEKGRGFSGQLPVSRMDRLCQSLHGGKGEVQVDLQFGKDEGGQAQVTGRLETSLQLQCQRCMEAMEMPLRVKVRLGIVRSQQQAEALPAEFDPLLVGEEPMRLADIVEDELILALPLVALHDRDECPAAGLLAAQGEPDMPASRRENPFAVLAQLKKDRND